MICNIRFDEVFFLCLGEFVLHTEAIAASLLGESVLSTNVKSTPVSLAESILGRTVGASIKVARCRRQMHVAESSFLCNLYVPLMVALLLERQTAQICVDIRVERATLLQHRPMEGERQRRPTRSLALLDLLLLTIAAETAILPVGRSRPLLQPTPLLLCFRHLLCLLGILIVGIDSTQWTQSIILY